jgi:Predicted nucleic-acid-binding protein containing a Zn-ribbon
MVDRIKLERDMKRNTLKMTLPLPYSWAIGETWTKFFDTFKNEKIMGSRCPECGRVLVPARKFCPRCFVDTTEEVEVKNEGILQGYTIVYYTFANQPRDPPYGIGVIKLDGADTGFTHFIGGMDFDVDKIQKQLVIGKTRLKAVWKDKKEGNIFDLDYFKPI